MPNEVSTVRALLLYHIERRPQMQLDDMYKLCHQATLGCTPPQDPAYVLRVIQNELDMLATSPGMKEELLETISATGGIVRLNFRPYLNRGGTAEWLQRAFVKTCDTRSANRDEFLDYWQTVVLLAAEGRMPFSADTAKELGLKMASLGFPGMHHTMQYGRLYRPAYRVIHRDLAHELLR